MSTKPPTYLRALALLAHERGKALGVALAGVAVAVVQLAEPILFGRAIDALTRGHGAFTIVLWWAGLGLIGIWLGVLVSVLADRLAHRGQSTVLRDAFEHVIAMPASHHAQRGSGAVLRTLVAGTDALFWIWLPMLREQLPALFGVLFLVPAGLAIDVRMSVILIVLALAYTVSNVFVLRKTASGQRAIENRQNEVSGRLSDVISNVTIVQSFTRLSAELNAMRDLLGGLLSARYPVLTWWGVLTVLQRSAATLTMLSVLAVGALLVERGELTVGEIVSFSGFATLLIGKLDQISSFALRTNQALPAIRTLFDLLDVRSRIVDREHALELPRPVGAVRYESVGFRYPGDAGTRDQGVFDLSFEVLPGQTCALVGPSGSGKSTTLALLQRMIELDSGCITVGGHDIRDLKLVSLRRAIAVVFQEAGLFNRSISENIEVGRPGATQAEIEHAARLAEAHEFASRKPGGYAFVIGERGAALSGGERQRLAIARAILKNAPLLILDEATSALDSETEARIKRALDHLRRDRTTFIIAHRLSTVTNADQILVMDRGRIVERGTFSELVALDGLFARMVREGGFTAPSS